MSLSRISIVAVWAGVIALSISIFAQNPQIPARGGQRPGGGKIRKMDTNNDGAISREEWKGRPRGFGRLDRNNDGTINREEIMSGRAKPGGKPGRQRIRGLDTNNDQKISREEWKGDPEVFGRLDTNKDGVLTREELKGRRRKQ